MQRNKYFYRFRLMSIFYKILPNSTQRILRNLFLIFELCLEFDEKKHGNSVEWGRFNHDTIGKE